MIIVTGGAGFVGSHLCERLLKEGNKVICVDNFYNSKYPNIHNCLQNKNYKFVSLDVNHNYLEQKLNFNDCDSIVHLAANIHVDKSIINPVQTYDTNLYSTLKLLEIVRKYDINRFILASSSEVYGTAQYKPIDEKHPLSAPHPYGASKIAADRLCNSYIETYGINIGISRCFNIFGPRQKGDVLGSFIPMTINKILKNKSPVIYGKGEQSRDYIFIDDVVESYMKLINSKESGEFNFGTGVENSILDITNKIIQNINKNITPIFINGRSSEVNSLIADSSKAKDKLGWEPKVTFDEGLNKTIEWYRRNI